ncbi:MAG: hypothetical protein A4E65_02379 [Syntrophorhabdus sp. PtaU1.Bin153]|nr:MAG: hypothetical protein A4E65_02379 [Syntrophorhabdus sp. PtaU1.Bin153]
MALALTETTAARKLEIFEKALSYMAAAVPRPTLYGPAGQIIPDSQYSYQRAAAARKGNMKN